MRANDLMTTAEAASLLGVSPRTLQKLLAEGHITCVRPGGRRVYFQQRDLDAYLDKTRS